MSYKAIFNLGIYDSDISMPKLHSHEVYELHFLLEGSREIIIDDTLLEIEAGTIAIIPPFTLHKTTGGAFRRINVNLPVSALTETEKGVLDKLAKTPVVKPDEETFKELKKLLETGVELQAKYGATDEDIPRCAAITIISLLSLSRLTPVLPKQSVIKRTDALDVFKIAEYIGKNYYEEIDLNALCRKFYTTKATLCRNFKSAMDCTIMEYLAKVRLKNTERMLLTTDEPIEAVAEKCGFSSGNYFRAAFKKAHGISPLKFRKSGDAL